jgi:hypothetical protein
MARSGVERVIAALSIAESICCWQGSFLLANLSLPGFLKEFEIAFQFPGVDLFPIVVPFDGLGFDETVRDMLP